MPAPAVQATVIIAALNAEAHIEQQLLALARQQTDVSWELIVADNGCTDGTLAIVERLAPKISAPVRIVDASARKGISAARNTAVAVAAGELLLFTDADDVVDERWVAEMVKALRRDPFVGGALDVLALNGEEVASWRLALCQGGLPLLGGHPYVVGCNFGCTAAALRTLGGFDETVPVYSEDVAFSLAMEAEGMPPVFAEGAIVQYRYRREPRRTVRQLWGYGSSAATLYARYGILPATFLDVAVLMYRGVKETARVRLSGRPPVRAVAEMALLLGESSVVWKDSEFWRPVTRRERVANPLVVQQERIHRLIRLGAAVWVRIGKA